MQAPWRQRPERVASVCVRGARPGTGRGSGRQEKNMTKHMLTAMASGLALMAATPALAQQGGTTVTTATTQGPILTFSASEEVRSRPDQPTVAGGEVRASSAPAGSPGAKVGGESEGGLAEPAPPMPMVRLQAMDAKATPVE